MFEDQEQLMPVLFVGHGSPMNAVEDNEFSRGWKAVAGKIPVPAAILCISAHWETKGPYVTAIENPGTIHDFGGFPQVLFEVQYPAPGNPALVQEIISMTRENAILPDQRRGLDHGTWSVLKNMYPKSDIPIVQLSLDYNKTPQAHYVLGKQLFQLRKKRILIVGSGNIVHNLSMVDWDMMDDGGYDWALEADSRIKKLITEDKHTDLINYASLGKEVQMAVPTPEHYLPLLYILALKGARDKLSFFNEKAVGGSLTMTSLVVGDM
ncbi:MAG: 4,5-DOPA dioxygenase extradiol [Bacteroidetes bacterium]|nr:4,5-DOPA dioxygenase extradiol [Bacteroidota bacterium]